MIFNCTDHEKISKIYAHPDVYSWLTDDTKTDLNIIIHPNILYLMNETENGVIRVDPVNSITCAIHIATIPELWGKTIPFVKEAFAWGFQNTLYQKIIAFIPVYNERTIGLAKKVGFVQEGRLTKSFLKDWKKYDQLIYSFNKGDKLCLP